MMNFIKRVIEDVIDNIESGKYGVDCKFSEIAFVFPTRRAGIYLKKIISEKTDKPLWLPDFFSIQDFIHEVANKHFPDNLELLFKLYESYNEKIGPIDNFLNFYKWGQTVLSDFNDIDQNLVDEKIFSDLKAFSELDSEDFANTYNRFTDNLKALYENFKKKLKEINSSYYGLALRGLINSFNEHDNPFRWKKIIFVGFNYITTGEEELFFLLREQNIAKFYWDIDEYFYADRNNEAGEFFRNSKLIDEATKWIDRDLETAKRKINIVGTQGNVGQAKILGSLLKNTDDETAIILADESLLFPVLNSIPDSIKDLNITMGSPVKNSPPYNFISLILNIIRDSIKGGGIINREDLWVILKSPYMLEAFGKEIENFLKKKDNKSPLEFSDLEKQYPNIAKLIFYKGKDTEELFDFIIDLILFIKRVIKNSDLVELEFLFAIHKQIKRTRELFLKHSPKIKIEEIIKIIIDILKNLNTPFSGEPLKGLQILGMLETRALDFKNVYITSVNEGIFPKGSITQTIIPNEIRIKYNMSYYKKQDSIFAYYFYRIIKGAENITILYNTDTDKYGKLEKSRFINQLNLEFKKLSSKTEISEELLKFNSKFSEQKAIEIIKTDNIINKLKSEKNFFSATALNQYIKCPLSFYFKYIKNIKEQDKIEDELDARNFGTLVHEILEDIYKKYLNKELNAKDIDNISAYIDKYIDYGFEKNNIFNTHSGGNYINRVIIKNLLINFFQMESENTPFTMLAVEKKMVEKFKIKDKNLIINLKGLADRIDLKNDSLRIIDYKTGRVSGISRRNIEKLQSEINLDILKDMKELVQLFVYNYLIGKDKEYKKYKNKILKIYSFKTPNASNEINSKDIIELDELSERVISTILSGILDKNKPFSQTKDKKDCEYCPYKNICYT